MLRLLQRSPMLTRLCLIAVLGTFGATACDGEQDTQTPEVTIPISPDPETIAQDVTSITGVVLNEETGAPIPNAVIKTQPASDVLRTDAQGRYVLSEGVSGDRVYRVTAEADGFTLASRVLVTRAGRKITSDFQMTPSLGTSPIRFEPEASFFPINKHIALHRITNTSATETVEWSLDLPEWISTETSMGSLPPNTTSIIALRIDGEGFAASTEEELDGRTILRDNAGRFRILNMKALRADPSLLKIQRIEETTGAELVDDEITLNLGEESVIVLQMTVQGLNFVGAELNVDAGGAVRDTLVTDGGGRVVFPVNAVRPGETTLRFSIPGYPTVPPKEITLRVLADDVDGDGISDNVDNCPEIANPEQEDLDEDTRGDACDPDRDGDGVDNDADNCPEISNTNQENIDEDDVGDLCDTDRDGDGVDNDADNCPDVLNADQSNLDEDDVGDLCDVDIDGDGVANDEDNCRLSPNAEQDNADGDELGDLCDLDIDGDGIDNDADNCALVANADQSNIDEDDVGDLCDTDLDGDGIDNDGDNCPNLPNAEQRDLDEDTSGDVCDGDIDGDGVANEEDNCALVANPGQENTDEDNEGDVCDGDTDGDGVPNEEDNCVLVANADQSNIDEDTDGDLCDTDLDGDGVDNISDNCPDVPNTEQSNVDEDDRGDLCDTDLDGDGVDNEEDNCPDLPNADQANLDEDEFGNLCDTDLDGDGVPEASEEDNCPGAPNPEQEDSDEDGLGDACDACPNDIDNDVDEDGVCGDVDNCPSDSNEDQSDLDEDGVGDVCDVCAQDPLDDADGDGFCADVDNCPDDPNPEQGDRDENGVGDVCDSCVEGVEWTDPVTGACELCPTSTLTARSFNFGEGSATRFDTDNFQLTFELLPGQAEVLSGTLRVTVFSFDDYGYGDGEGGGSVFEVPVSVDGGILTADLLPLVENESFDPFVDSITGVELDLTERCDDITSQAVRDFAIRIEPDEVLNVLYFRPTECVQEFVDNTIGQDVSTGSTVARGRDHNPSELCTSTTSDDVGISWIAPFDGVYTVDTFGSDFDTMLYALPAQCDGEPIACNDDSSEDLTSQITLEASAGEEFVLVVAGYASGEGDYRLNIIPEEVSCPAEQWVNLSNITCQACPGGQLDSGLFNFEEGSTSGLDVFSGRVTFELNPGIAQLTSAVLLIEGFDFDGYGAASAAIPLDVGLNSLTGRISEEFDLFGEGISKASLLLADVCDPEIIVDVTDIIIQVEPGEVASVRNFREQRCVERDLESTLGRLAEGDLRWEGRDHEAPGECVSTSTDDIGFLWTAPAEGQFTFNTFGSDLDTVLYVLPPLCEPIALACNDDDPITHSPESRVTIDAEENESFVVVLAGSGSELEGDYILNVQRTCEEGQWFNNFAETCQACPASILDSNAIDFTDGSPTRFDPLTREIFFQLRPGLAQVTRAAAFVQGLFPFLGQERGVPLPQAFLELEVRGDLLVGRLDDLLESGFDINEQGIGNIELILEEPCSVEPQTISDLVVQIEPSDGGFIEHNLRARTCFQEDLGTAIGSVAQGDTLFQGRDHDAPDNCNEEPFFSFSDDVGYLWTAPADGLYEINTFGSEFDTVLYVLPPACFPNLPLACNNDAFGGKSQESFVFLEAEAGQQYVIVVAGAFDRTGPFQLNIFDGFNKF